MDRMARALAPLGILKGAADQEGADINVLTAIGFPAFELIQDSARYFDHHHTPDDTWDKVDPAQPRQMVAAWATVLAIAANEPAGLESSSRAGGALD
jgi:hypothetical protein